MIPTTWCSLLSVNDLDAPSLDNPFGLCYQERKRGNHGLDLEGKSVWQEDKLKQSTGN